MAKVSIDPNQIKRALSNINRNYVTTINRSGILNSTLKNLKADIRKGINPKTGRNYPRLAKSTVKQRELYKDVNPTHPAFNASKANVTFTGQLVDSLKATITSFRNGVKVAIRATGIHRGKNLIRGGRSKSVSNSKLVGFLEEAGYPILAISKRRLDIIAKKIARKLNSI